MSTAPIPGHIPHTPIPRALGIGVALAVVVGIIVLAFSWPTVTSSVKDLPIAVVGTSAQVEQVETALSDKSPGTFAFTEADTRADAAALLKQRKAYGAIVLGTQPEVLTASAASPIVSQLLTGVAAQLQVQLNAALVAQHVTLPQPLVVTVTDVVPLSDRDPRGVGLIAAAFPLTLGGMLGGILITMLIVGAWRRILSVLLYSLVAGLGITAILQGWFGSLQGDYLVNAAAIALSTLAIGATIVGFAALVGRPGVAIGPVLFLLIANPISAASQPLEFLAKPWGAVGQWFPPGASATLLRDLSYFPDANVTFPWLVLGAWSVVGLALGIVGHFRTSVVEEPGLEPVPA